MSRWSLITLVAGLLAAEAFAAEPNEPPITAWRDVTLRLEGALPNEHRKLQDSLKLLLGRTPKGQWRSWVLGSSVFPDPRNLRAHDYRVYNWIDDEGKLLSADDDGEWITLKVAMTIHPDPWVAGGDLTATIKLRQSGKGRLSGTYKGVFRRDRKSPAGEAGEFDISGEVSGQVASEAWPAPVEKHRALSPGEHPRLIFRKSDRTHLRERMETPLGKMILARLAEAMDPNDRSQGSWRGYGYGLMYQLTEDEAWARKGRDFCEAVIAGELQSPRYGWATTDGGYMRSGPSAAAVAATYDLCYDAWDEDFRRKIARKLQDRVWPNMAISPSREESDAQYSPRSNHYLLWNGGAGLVALAILDDPGVDSDKIRRGHRIWQRRLKRGLVQGYGDHGWFWEGTFCGRFPANIAATQYIQALRVARGADYVASCSQAQWLISRWMFEAVRSGGKVRYSPRGMYARMDNWNHFNGDFAMGFGILPDEHRPAALHFCREVLNPGRKFGVDATGVRELVYAYVNWPDGLEPKDPADVLPVTLWDRQANFFVFRSGWEGEGDIIVSMRGDARVIGMGLEENFPVAIPVGPHVKVTHFDEQRDERLTVVAAEVRDGEEASDYHFAADFSGLSGSKALLVGMAPAAADSGQGLSAEKRKKLKALLKNRYGSGKKEKKARAADAPGADIRQLALSGRTVQVMTIQKGPSPDVKVVGKGDGAAIVVGRRRITFDGKKLAFGKTGWRNPQRLQQYPRSQSGRNARPQVRSPGQGQREGESKARGPSHADQDLPRAIPSENRALSRVHRVHALPRGQSDLRRRSGQGDPRGALGHAGRPEDPRGEVETGPAPGADGRSAQRSRRDRIRHPGRRYGTP